MSAEATGYVYRHAPYSGAEFTILHAIADSVNDQHDNEFWMTQGTLAAKARCTDRWVRSALDRFIRDGWLEELEGRAPARGGRAVRRFRFLFPDRPVVYETRGANRNSRPVDNGDQPEPTSGRNRNSARNQPEPTSDGTQREPKVEPKTPLTPLRTPGDEVVDHGEKLVALAVEQRVKPPSRRQALVIVVKALNNGRTYAEVDRAIRGGVDVWTDNGLATAIAKTRAAPVREHTRWRGGTSLREDLEYLAKEAGD